MKKPAHFWVKINTEVGKLILEYRFREYGGAWQPVTECVSIEHVACAFGGARPYFRCPGVVDGRRCGRRVGKLYNARYFVCRHCLRLAYPVQSEEVMHRHLRRANKKRAALGVEPGACSLLTKPKGMHWQTYNRIVDEIRHADDGADTEFLGWAARRFPGLAKRDLPL